MGDAGAAIAGDEPEGDGEDQEDGRWKMEGILMIIQGFGFGSVWTFSNICLTSILKLYQTDKHFFLYFAFHIAQVHLNLVNK